MAGEHAHGPDLTPVHRRIDPPSKGIVAGEAELAGIVKVWEIARSIDPSNRMPRDGAEFLRPLGQLLQRGTEGLLFPCLYRRLDPLLFVFIKGH